MKVLLSTLVLMMALPLFAEMEPVKCLDINKATVKELQTLKGVGPKIAKQIIEYRKLKRVEATKKVKALKQDKKVKSWNFLNWAEVLKVKSVTHKVCMDNIGVLCFSGKLQKNCPKKPAKAKKK